SRIDPTGQVAPGWPMTGSIAAPGAGAPEATTLVATGSGRAIVVWLEKRNGSQSAYAKAVEPGPAGPPLPLTAVLNEPVDFGIQGVRPNPTHGTLWAVVGLSKPGPAEVELFDLAGRVLESRTLNPGGPAARGAVRFNESGQMSAGVYWLRLRQGTSSASTRVVVAN